MTRSQPPPNIKHELRSNTLSVTILLLFDYIIDYVAMILILCPPDKYPQSYTIRKPALISAHNNAVDAHYLSVIYYIKLAIYGNHIIPDC